MFIFTYGTLMRGFGNHFMLDQARFVQEAKTKPMYGLYDCGHYPCMVRGDKAVHGEVYEIYPQDKQTLAHLDWLEGVPHLYQRSAIQLEDFKEPVEAYLYQRDVSRFIECSPSWPRKQ